LLEPSYISGEKKICLRTFHIGRNEGDVGTKVATRLIVGPVFAEFERVMRKTRRAGCMEHLESRRYLAGVPTPDHVVVVIEENQSYNEIIGNSSAPYINSLASQGAVFTNSFAITHPSQPNYLALFSGSTQGNTDDNPVGPFPGPDLASSLAAVGRTFGGYSEDLPSTGSLVITSGNYARKHNPWSDFSDVPASENMPFTSFPTNYASLPTVSIVVPNIINDMHDGTIAQGDSWLQTNIGAYATWAKTHNSLLIVTWDEDDSSQNNQIPTIFYGQQVKPGAYSEHINHYNVLRTIEDMYGLAHINNTATATPITDTWQIESTSISSNGAAQITLLQDPDHSHIDWYMGATNGKLSINNASGLTIDTNGASDTLVLNYANGSPLPNTLHLSGTVTITGLSGTNPLAGTMLEIGKSTVYLAYVISDPVAAIKTYLQNGYNGGSWNGTPTATTGVITSAAAQTNHGYMIGYADSADHVVSGQPANTIELKYTLGGDLDLNGTVNFSDYALIIANYGKPAAYDHGAITYDSTVSFADFAILVGNYGKQAITSASAIVSSAASVSSAAASTATIVAEPATTRRHTHTPHR
jgi:hypothetical protein